MREEVDDLSKSLHTLNTIIQKIRNDQLRSIASCRNALCLSCGRGDATFMPPLEFLKATNGQYYRAHSQDSNLYDHGKDVFTKQEVCREHTIHAHMPVDALMSVEGDINEIPQSKKIQQKRMLYRPQTAAVRIGSRAGRQAGLGSAARQRSVENQHLTVSNTKNLN